MSKLSNTLLLLKILSSGTKYSIDELSKKLECSPRMVRIYKEELEKVGIYIDTIRGPYGGYILNKVENIPNVYFNDDDIKLLEEYQNNAKIDNLINKMKLHSKSELLLDDDVKNKFNLVHRAIKEKRRLKIKYNSYQKGISERIIEPHELSLYQGKWELIAFCKVKNDIRTFELDRIINIEILNEIYK